MFYDRLLGVVFWAMAKKIILEVTDVQLAAICNITDTISAMIGTGSDFDEIEKDVKAVDRMLKKNGYKRIYK